MARRPSVLIGIFDNEPEKATVAATRDGAQAATGGRSHSSGEAEQPSGQEAGADSYP